MTEVSVETCFTRLVVLSFSLKYLRICMKTKFCQLHFKGRSTLHKIGEHYLSDRGWYLSSAKMQFWLVAKQK